MGGEGRGGREIGVTAARAVHRGGMNVGVARLVCGGKATKGMCGGDDVWHSLSSLVVVCAHLDLGRHAAAGCAARAVRVVCQHRKRHTGTRNG